MKMDPLAGSVPYIAVAILCAGAFAGGRATQPPHDKVAVVEKGAVLLEAILWHPDATPDQMKQQISQPIRDVLGRYAAQGYTVIDISRDEHGYMEVAAYPSDAIDITDELRAAVNLPKVARAAASPTGASAAGTGTGAGNKGSRGEHS